MCQIGSITSLKKLVQNVDHDEPEVYFSGEVISLGSITGGKHSAEWSVPFGETLDIYFNSRF